MDLAFQMEPYETSWKVGPKPIFINGLMGPLPKKMAENKWVNAGEMALLIVVIF